jgi:hypothetical protein
VFVTKRKRLLTYLKNRNNEDCVIKLSCENEYLNNARSFLLMKNLIKPLD